MSSVAEVFGMSDSEVNEAITAILNFHVIELLSYGIYTMIFISTMHQIGARSADKWPSQRIVLTIIICVIWVLATVEMGIGWHGLLSTYVIHGQSQNSVLGYIMEYGYGNWSQKRLILNVVADTIVALNAILAELINIWRCWELYNQSYLIAGLPLLCVLCGFLSHILCMMTKYSVDPSTTASIAQINWSIVYYSVTASTNVLTTFLIIFRILSIGGLKSAKTYRGLLKILVESAFLYSTTYILYLALYVRDAYYLPYWSFTNYYVEGLLNAVTAAAPIMIIGRVMAGGSRPNDSWTRSSLPPLGSGMRSLAESIRFGSVHPADTQNTATSLDTGAGPAEDARVDEENLGVSGEAVASRAGESEAHVGSDPDDEIQVERREGAEMV